MSSTFRESQGLLKVLSDNFLSSHMLESGPQIGRSRENQSIIP